MIQHDVTAFYMRDNHTFKKLNIHDPDEFLRQIKEEHYKGWSSGMLCSKHKCAPNPIHNNGDIDVFLLFAKRWLDQFLERSSKEFTAVHHGGDIIIF